MSIKNPYKKGGMFENANYLLFQRAKKLRNTLTDAEIILWINLQGGINGLKFRRQHPIGKYIADFYCYKAKLIIEIDGSIHRLADVQELDTIKQKDLEALGYHVIRFTNKDIQLNIEKVLDSIRETVIKITNLQNQNASSMKGV